MAISKRYIKGKPDVCRVRFELSARDIDRAEQVHVAGDFNDWDVTAWPMTRRKGSFVFTADLPAGRDYQFRYVVDGNTWHNDSQADRFVNSGVGDSLNSVIAV